MAPNANNVTKPKKYNPFTRFAKSFSLARQLRKRREGTLIETLQGHESGINSMGISVDESILITGSEDSKARVWAISAEHEAMDDRCLGVLEGHAAYITCVSLMDQFVFTGSADGDIRKWDIATCECVFVYKGHNSKIHKMLVTESFVFSTSHDKTARVWYTDVGDSVKACVRTLKGHSHGVYPLVFLPSNFDDDDDVDAAADDGEEHFHQDDLLITGAADTNIKFWSLYSGECLATLTNHMGSVVALATDPKGQILYSCGSDSFIKYWDIATRKQLKSIEAHRSPIVTMYINHRLMYTGSQDGTAKCWVAEFGDNTVVYKGHTMTVTVIKFYKGLVLTGCGDGIVRCFEAKSGHLLRTYSGHEGAILALNVARDKIYSTTVDGVVRVWSIDWKFVRVYMAVLAGDIDSILEQEEQEVLAEEINDHSNGAIMPVAAAAPQDEAVPTALSPIPSPALSRKESNASAVAAMEEEAPANANLDDQEMVEEQKIDEEGGEGSAADAPAEEEAGEEEGEEEE